jgi:sugar (pentulose or hexulose) kinase
MTPDLVVGIDSSTTATKAIAWTRRGVAVAEGRAPVALSTPRPGWFEQEVGEWTGSLSRALRQLTRKLAPARIAALAISNQRESFAQFDAADRPLRPATLWLDERAHREVKDLARELGAEVIHRISGMPPDLTPCIYRCRWLSTHMPGLWKKTAKTAEVHGVLAHFLTGRWVTSLASASPMGVLDVQARDWSEPLLKAARLRRDMLPDLVAPGAVMGAVSAAAAKATGLAAGTPVAAGGGDGQCAGPGVNVFHKGRAFLNLGTAAVSGSFGATYAIDPAFRSLIAVGETGYSFEAAIRTGTFLVNWMAERLFNVAPGKVAGMLADLEREAALSPPGANGLVLVPYWSGCMTPYWDTGARGVIAGLSGNHGRGDLYRALLEGVALEQTMMTDRLARATSPIDHYVIVGGGSQSDLWCQIVADVSGRVVKRLETAEASALGAAMAAAKAAGWFATVAEASAAMAARPVKTFRPRSKPHRRYQELLAVYQDLWPTVTAWNARLQAFNHGELAAP